MVGRPAESYFPDVSVHLGVYYCVWHDRAVLKMHLDQFGKFRNLKSQPYLTSHHSDLKSDLYKLPMSIWNHRCEARETAV